MHSDDNFYLYLELLRGAKPKPYDLAGDPVGEFWGAARLSETSGCGKLNRNRR